ncbi:hypothetical protein F4823DRAFT_558006 [Ustulina deusta]|nr:hypothetical protein F4823DRAFT_558006 [Ustulina deusta]
MSSFMEHDKSKLYGTDRNAKEPTWPSYDAADANGNYAYVVLEESSEVAQYSVGEDGTLHLVGDIYPLSARDRIPLTTG